MANFKVINGSQIDLDHEDIKSSKSVSDLKKLNIFPAGNEDGYKELLDAAKGKSEKPADKEVE